MRKKYVIRGYLVGQGYWLKRLKDKFIHHFEGTRSPEQGTFDLAIWEKMDNVYVDKDHLKVKVTIEILNKVEKDS